MQNSILFCKSVAPLGGPTSPLAAGSDWLKSNERMFVIHYFYSKVLHKHLPDCPGASKSQIRASILKHQEMTVARIGQAKSLLWRYMYDFQNKNNSFSFWGKTQVKMSFGQVFLLHLYFTCPNGQVLIKCSTLCIATRVNASGKQWLMEFLTRILFNILISHFRMKSIRIEVHNML